MYAHQAVALRLPEGQKRICVHEICANYLIRRTFVQAHRNIQHRQRIESTHKMRVAHVKNVGLFLLLQNCVQEL